MTELLIKITPEVLERAKMCGMGKQTAYTPTNCAIALAVRDIFPKAVVGFDIIRPFNDDLCINHDQNEFIMLFDGTPVAERPLMTPFSFTVKLPDEVVERIDISDIEKSQTLELVNA